MREQLTVESLQAFIKPWRGSQEPARVYLVGGARQAARLAHLTIDVD